MTIDTLQGMTPASALPAGGVVMRRALIAHELGHAMTILGQPGGYDGDITIVDEGDHLAVRMSAPVPAALLAQGALCAMATGAFYRHLASGKPLNDILATLNSAMSINDIGILADAAVSEDDKKMYGAAPLAPDAAGAVVDFALRLAIRYHGTPDFLDDLLRRIQQAGFVVLGFAPRPKDSHAIH